MHLSFVGELAGAKQEWIEKFVKLAVCKATSEHKTIHIVWLGHNIFEQAATGILCDVASSRGIECSIINMEDNGIRVPDLVLEMFSMFSYRQWLDPEIAHKLNSREINTVYKVGKFLYSDVSYLVYSFSNYNKPIAKILSNVKSLYTRAIVDLNDSKTQAIIDRMSHKCMIL
jgi:hypothetical protein